jgi:hypothetical protein
MKLKENFLFNIVQILILKNNNRISIKTGYFLDRFTQKYLDLKPINGPNPKIQAGDLNFYNKILVVISK